GAGARDNSTPEYILKSSVATRPLRELRATIDDQARPLNCRPKSRASSRITRALPDQARRDRRSPASRAPRGPQAARKGAAIVRREAVVRADARSKNEVPE